MEKIFEIASSISTPLALGGLFAAIVFYIFKRILEKSPQLPRTHGKHVIVLIIERLFVLALVAMILGFVGYVVTKVIPQAPAPRAGDAVAYRACRHPDFGQVGWVRSDTISQTSGRRDGGSNPQNWCNELANSFIQARSIGPQHLVEVLGMDQSHDKDWKGHVTYNYSCRVKISWEPLYDERQDPRCGVAD